MRKLHIINLEKMGGVERLFLQYIQDVTTNQDCIFWSQSDFCEPNSEQLSD